jgi:alpha-galactosidase
MKKRAWSVPTCGVVVVSVLAAAALAQETQLARTPPMGWNSWNHFGTSITDAIVRAQADAMISSGMKDVGYTYLIIDDGWEGKRDETGVLQPNEKFPDMKQLADYARGKGLKLGIYSSPGPKTCGGFEGSLGHEEQDARQFAAWGIDYLKYDWCSGQGDMKAAYTKMRDALRSAGRPIVYSVCQYGIEKVWTWGPSVGGHLWRTTMDIADNYDKMSVIGFTQNGLERFAGPGHWNDPDMLEVGNGGMSQDEYRTHMALWSMLAAPLIAGNDLTRMTPETVAILTNPDVVGINQDPAGIQGHRAAEEGPLEVWMKPLADGSVAVGLFNRAPHSMPMTVSFTDVHAPENATVRDLWGQKDIGTFQGSFTTNVGGHGVFLIKLKDAGANVPTPTTAP